MKETRNTILCEEFVREMILLQLQSKIEEREAFQFNLLRNSLQNISNGMDLSSSVLNFLPNERSSK